jgi:hypothetical protein
MELVEGQSSKFKVQSAGTKYSNDLNGSPMSFDDVSVSYYLSVFVSLYYHHSRQASLAFVSSQLIGVEEQKRILIPK